MFSVEKPVLPQVRGGPLIAEDYRVIRFCHQHKGTIKPAELTVRWRAYHDHPGRARSKLNALAESGVGLWRGTKDYPNNEFVLNDNWMEYLDHEKSTAFWNQIAGVLLIGGLALFLGPTVAFAIGRKRP